MRLDLFYLNELVLWIFADFCTAETANSQADSGEFL